jgi:ABC-type xylose transport system, periplasmic component
MFKKRSGVIIIITAVILILGGCGRKNELESNYNRKEDKLKIGLSFDSFVIERWQRDRDVFVSTAQDLGAEVNVQNANGDVKQQISQINYFIDKEMDVIVIIAVDSEACKEVLKKAREAGIIVIAYDRLVRNANANLYISFDNEQVGRLMAEALAENVPAGGNIVTIFGPTTDHNVTLVKQGFNDYRKKHSLNIVYSVYAKEWLAEEAYNAVNEALNRKYKIDGVLCGNDDLASQAVRALSENRLAGKVVVTGQDADLAACQRIVEGTQTMTVYKPVNKLAEAAAKYAVKLARGETIGVTEKINDGSYNIPYVKLEPIAVTKNNIDKVIIDGGFQQKEEVYLNVPDRMKK